MCIDLTIAAFLGQFRRPNHMEVWMKTLCLPACECQRVSKWYPRITRKWSFLLCAFKGYIMKKQESRVFLLKD